MTGHEQNASFQRNDSEVRFPRSLDRGQNSTARWMLVTFAQFLVLMISLAFAATGALAQATTGISGVVEDSSGAVVPNANIVATETETNYTEPHSALTRLRATPRASCNLRSGFNSKQAQDSGWGWPPPPGRPLAP